MRDLLPAESAAIGATAAELLSCFASEGYQRVTTPAFEYADVLERGLEVDRRDLVRFVEPDTGEVALLRPDITPQIARIVATQLQDRPAPWRLSYQGTVIRRRRGRARKERQAIQAGVECIGLPGLEADVEVMRLACRAVHAVGLRDVRLELGQVGLARHALQPLSEGARDAAEQALARKDIAALERVAADAGATRAERKTLCALVDLYGDLDVMPRARKALGSWAKPMLDEVEAVAANAPDGVALGVDLGEPRGHAYYTGVSFSLLAPGPGETIGGGGRYDDLVGRFGEAQPATGFGLDVDHLRWALRAAGVEAAREATPKFVVVDDAELTRALREAGAIVATLPKGRRDGLEYARAWGYDALVGARTARRVDGAERRRTMDVPALFAWARGDED